MPLKVLYAASEVMPLAKTGGLADVAGSLPLALARLGADVRVVTPAYRGSLEQLREPRRVAEFQVHGQDFMIWDGRLRNSGLRLWLLDCPALFARDGDPYRDAQGRDFGDNAWRFGCFAEAVARLAGGEAPGWRCDVLHLNDWQTGLAPVRLRGAASRPRIIFTIHNLAYQGVFDRKDFDALALPAELWNMHALEFHGRWSFMKGGLLYSDVITTVSPTYAREIQTPEFGEGLDGLLRHRAAALRGILNGIDDELWNPQRDPLIARTYDIASVDEGKRANKQQLQRELGLTVGDAPLLGVISRLASQKGIDLLLDAAPRLLESGLQLVVLGSGDAHLEAGLRAVARAHPARVAVRIAHDEKLAHLIEAGADLFLMASRYEPSGLNQMYSQRYGTIPVVRRVGGLVDSVTDATPATLAARTATGVLFDHADVGGVLHGIHAGLKLWSDRDTRRHLQQAGMQRDFSWKQTAGKFLDLYSSPRG
jgi:starch synthase